MLRIFRRIARRRDIYFHEDDYCQQQLLPRGATAHANAELKEIAAFAEAHRAPDGTGWTDIYMRDAASTELHTLGIKREQFERSVSPFLPRFDVVYTGYGSHREQCRNTAAWGTSPTCALLADWNDEGIIANAWTMFFDRNEASILAASRAVAALAELHPFVYVDWAWGYTCEASDSEAFASLLRTKLQTIAETRKSFEKG